MKTREYSRQGLTVLRIEHPSGSQAEILPERGGQVVSLHLPTPEGPRECLFRDDDFWTNPEAMGGNPFLFPICGRLEADGVLERYHLDDQTYHMPIHGFGHRLPWTIMDHQADTIRLTLSTSPQTREMFPFAFTVQMQHTVTGKGLQTQVTIINEDRLPMPCYAGFHPYFLTPLDQKPAIRLSMDARERYAYNDSYTAVTGHLDLPAFPVPIHTPDMNEQLFCIPVGTEASLSFPDQSRIALTCHTDAPQDRHYIQTFTHTHQPFFCVEPWMNIPNTLNATTEQPVMAPGQKRHLALSIELLAPSTPSS